VKKRKLTADAMGSPRDIIGRTVRTPIKKGQPFLTTDLYPEGMGPSVAERLKPGLRAVAVAVDDTAAVAGLAGPGSFVDVLFRTKARAGLQETTVTLIQNVEILALGETMLPGARADKKPDRRSLIMVTLAVSPAQASALRVVESHGDLSLAIRSPEEGPQVAANANSKMTLNKLLGVSSAGGVMEIYRGGARQVLTFEQQRVVDEKFGGVDAPAVTPTAVKKAAVPDLSSTTIAQDD
jgi:Flp pilus assembly protein CpaB